MLLNKELNFEGGSSDLDKKKDVISTSLSPINIGSKKPNSDDIKIICGINYDIRQPVPIKYPEVRDRFLQARKNFWTPDEVSMAEDKFQWQSDKVTEAEKFLFKTNISYLSAGDNLVPDNIIDVIMKHITANEMRQNYRWIIGEEANHMESYLFILESFGLDVKGQGDIFNLYRDIPSISRKVNWNLEFANNSANSKHELGSFESKKNLLIDIFSYYIFEYLFFPLGFCQIFALDRQNKLRNTAQQYIFIWRDETLHAENALWLIKQIIKENKEVWNAKVKQYFREILSQAVDLEIAFAYDIMPDGGISGMSLNSYNNYVKFIANNICGKLDLEILDKTIKSHPLSWMSEYEMKADVNFFEGRPPEYKVGTKLTWD